ncbi:MAG: family 10 glycosylhydrolase [Thermoguttaceae bacterium]
MRAFLTALALVAATLLWSTDAMAAKAAAKKPAKAPSQTQKPARVKPAYPDGEVRGTVCMLPKGGDREKGMQEIEAALDSYQSAGLNTVLIWVTSRYLATMDDPKLQKPDPTASWDALGEYLRAAKKRGIQVHAWYSPWIRKAIVGSVELEQHPEWAALTTKGTLSPKKDAVCFVRPEVRQYELDVLSKMMDRYPDFAGIHIEEPGYKWLDDYCYCDTCRAFCQENFGLDIRKNLEASKPTVHSLAAFMCTDFFIRLRKIMLDKRPDMWLSANGGYNDAEWYIGRDWHTWARRGLIDFYMPQIYCRNVAAFTKRAAIAKESLAGCDMIPILGITWQAVAPQKQPPTLIQEEIAITRKLDAKGFFLFPARALDDTYYRVIAEAAHEKRNLSTKP